MTNIAEKKEKVNMNTKQEIMTVVRTLTWLKLTNEQQDSFLHDLYRLLKRWVVAENYKLSQKEEKQISRLLNQ